MSFKTITILALTLFFLFGGDVFADTLVLKSGKEIQGKIIEKTADYVKIDCQGAPLYYENKYIQTIRADEQDNNSVPVKSQDVTGPESQEKQAAPAWAAVFMKRGLELASQGKFEEARKVFAKGLEANNSDPNFQGALTVLDDLNQGKIKEEFARSLFKGSYYLEKGDYAQAAVSLEDALKLKPDDPDVSYNLAVAYQNMNKEEEAIKCLLAVIETNPQDAEAYSLMGTLYYSKGDYAKAKDNFIIAKGLYQKKGFDDKVEEIDGILEEF